MNNINNALPNFNIEDTDVLCSDVHGNMAVGTLEYDENHNIWNCVRFIGYGSKVLLCGVVYWKFTSEIFNGLAASKRSENMCFHSFD
jgi:hypothetical protein